MIYVKRRNSSKALASTTTRSWRWSLADIALGGLGGWIVFDGASMPATLAFIVANAALAVGFLLPLGRNWRHPSPWDLPVMVVANLILLAWPIFIPMVMMHPVTMMVSLVSMVASRAVIGVCSLSRAERAGTRIGDAR